MSVKLIIKSFLEKSDLYLKIRFSNILLTYFQGRNPSLFLALEKEKEYYLDILSEIKKDKKNVFDIGAHEGYISAFLLKQNFKVLAVEPDSRNQRVLRARFSKNKNFQMEKKGVSDKKGSALFFKHYTNSAFNTLNNKWKDVVEQRNDTISFHKEMEPVELITLDILIAERDIPAFIKIDVEGHELEVINGLNQKVPLLSFEANFPDFKEETFLCIKKLESICEDSRFNFSKNYKLEFDEFVSSDVLVKRLKNFDKETCLEIFCKMSNYSDYFNN